MLCDILVPGQTCCVIYYSPGQTCCVIYTHPWRGGGLGWGFLPSLGCWSRWEGAPPPTMLESVGGCPPPMPHQSPTISSHLSPRLCTQSPITTILTEPLRNMIPRTATFQALSLPYVGGWGIGFHGNRMKCRQNLLSPWRWWGGLSQRDCWVGSARVVVDGSWRDC